jgi:hypothetical protein
MPVDPPELLPRRAVRSGLLVSLLFHLGVLGLLAWFAAREGMLGQPMKQITVRLMAPPSPKPAPPAKATPEPAKKEAPVLAEATPRKVPLTAPLPASTPRPVPSAWPLVRAPAPAEMPALAFDDGGKTVQTESDPAALYRSYVEFSLRSRWNRPTDIADEHYVAVVEVAIDASGRITDPRWKRKTGDARWDASVMDAIVQARRLDRPPPTGFPARLSVRFDVVQTAELNLQ